MTTIIGLGSMGAGMSKNMLARAIPLRGYDICKSARSRFAQMGGHSATNIAEAASGSDLLILMVVDAAQIREVLFGEGAALSVLSAGATVMICSTIAPTDTRLIAKDVAQAGMLLLDAPVSGGKIGADNGTLTIMASGPQAAFDAAATALKAIAKKVHYLGDEPGVGSTYKTVHQLAAAAHLVVAAELMAFGAKAGCDPQKLFDIVSTSAGQSWMFNDRVPRILDGDYTPRSTVDIFIKDIELVLREGSAHSTPLPISAAVHQILLSAAAMGYGELDDSAVVKVYESITGVPSAAKTCTD